MKLFDTHAHIGLIHEDQMERCSSYNSEKKIC